MALHHATADDGKLVEVGGYFVLEDDGGDSVSVECEHLVERAARHDGVLERSDVGNVLEDVETSYRTGDVAEVKFVGANPRNNLRSEGTFAAVEHLQADGTTWKQVRDDSDWFLVLSWARTSTVSGTSEVVISWETAEDGGKASGKTE